MKISTSFLSIKDNLKENLIKLSKTTTDFIHLDIMDGKFVNNKSWHSYELEYLKDLNKPLDVHLMVKDVYKYIDEFKVFNPSYITFHYEATVDPYLVIDYIKKNNIKVGIAINPDTNIEVLNPFLEIVDLVLIMSVKPGLGGQEFIQSSVNKINDLVKIRKENNLKFLLEVDGGINNTNIKNIKADMIVVGNFITSGDYQAKINDLKNNI